MTRRAEHAVMFVAKERADLLEVPPPALPLESDEVSGRTLATAVSVGTELASFREQMAHYPPPTYPHGSGYAAVFRADEIGSDVQGIRPGDRLFAMGPHRSFQRLKAAAALPVPDGLPDSAAPLARLMGVSMSTLVTAAARPPARILVTGLGIVGNLAAQVFQSCGYEVTAVDPDDSRARIARAAGLHDVRAAVPVDDPLLAGKVELVVECSGHEQAVLDACRLVRKRGEVVLVGVPWARRTNLSAFDLLDLVFHNYAVVRSGWEWEVPGQPADFVRGSMSANFAAAMRWLRDGRVRVDGLYETVAPGDAPRVYDALARGQWPALTAVFVWDRA